VADDRPTADQVERFDEHLVAFTAEVAMLRFEVAEERDARRTLAIIVSVVGGATVILLFALAGIGYIVWQNRTSIRQGAAIQENFVECTTPDNPAAAKPSLRVHECFDRSVAQQAAAVQQVVDGTVKAVIDALRAEPRSLPQPTP
jgi:hypothetical protein